MERRRLDGICQFSPQANSLRHSLRSAAIPDCVSQSGMTELQGNNPISPSLYLDYIRHAAHDAGAAAFLQVVVGQAGLADDKLEPRSASWRSSSSTGKPSHTCRTPSV